MAHELAHIWLGISGVDDLDIYGNDKTEVLCNKIAAEVLVPSKEFFEYWDILDGDLSSLAQHFYVSKLMISRVALTYKKLSISMYREIHDSEFEKFKAKRDADTGKPSFIKILPIRNSSLLTKTIVNQALAGNILLRDAGKLLNASPQNILKLGGMK